MFITIEKLQNEVPKSGPDSKAASALQEILGGKFGETTVMMQYLFQTFNFRVATNKTKPYRDLLRSKSAE